MRQASGRSLRFRLAAERAAFRGEDTLLRRAHSWVPVKFIVLAIVVSHLAAVSAPCPGDAVAAPPERAHEMATMKAGHAAAAHAQHATEQARPAHRARHCEEGQPDTMQAKCPCGCGGLPYSAGSFARVGYGLLPAAIEAVPDFFCARVNALTPGDAIAPAFAPDHVPILFLLG